MDYGKIDAALAMALEDVAAAGEGEGTRGTGGSPQLSVFVHLDPESSARDRAALTGLGLPEGALRSSIATATLSAQDIAQLSEHPCVRQLRLSTPLRLLDQE